MPSELCSLRCSQQVIPSNLLIAKITNKNCCSSEHDDSIKFPYMFLLRINTCQRVPCDCQAIVKGTLPCVLDNQAAAPITTSYQLIRILSIAKVETEMLAKSTCGKHFKCMSRID